MQPRQPLSASLPLGEDWQALIAGVAKEKGWPTGTKELISAVAELSRVYNGLAPGLSARGPRALSARLGFSFPRDVAKAASAVQELIGAGLLDVAGGTLSLLDIGAGMGAMTVGVAIALARAGQRGRIDATWVDADLDAMRAGESLLRGASRIADIEVSVRGLSQRDVKDAVGTFDLVVVGQVVSELDVDLDETQRAEKHAQWLETILLDRVREHGALVIIEPALRDRTRHLHRVRDRLAASQAVTIFAPCLHRAACPALSAKGDWCHEDLPIDLPEWLVPIARGAGLRWEGLTFSYLIVRRDGATLSGAANAGAGLVRVVSSARVTKGKRELQLCGDTQAGPGRVKALVLDRERDNRAAWDSAARGDLLRFDPPVGHGRVALQSTRVERVDGLRRGD